RGIWNQLWIAQNSNAVANAMWGSLQFSVPNAVANFTGWLGSNGSSLTYHVPFVAFAKYTNTFTWSANDPLVHYMASDLSDLTSYTMANNLMVSTNVTTASLDPLGAALTPANLMTNLSQRNAYRYLPWGATSPSPLLSSSTLNLANNLAYKDPLISQSDNWQFPTNRFPNIGWLGRVHRGTPWQTLYLKSTPVSDANILNHSVVVTYPNGSIVTNNYANHASWEY